MKTMMEVESLESPSVVERQLMENKNIIEKIAAVIQEKKPTFAMTIGRGSSDNACNYAKYLIETQMCLVTASAAPSVITIYQANLCLKNSLVIGISQSGQQYLVDSLPYSRFLPVAQSPPAGHTRTTTHFLGQHFPWYARHQHKKDAC